LPSTYFAIDQVELLDLIHDEAKANFAKAMDSVGLSCAGA
jgi:hypothetical protein